ncbi:hypothetical protein RF11_16487 [Thelohanellus kitauei]|uniref:Uncharacterized protein n=1 Tax=Thelohanellus kitauei TaxID=669202 RepID=A0A0C2NGP9_THEKT|nr:hypothetical protein RF11_16487 [Thelohanellus kitauei]
MLKVAVVVLFVANIGSGVGMKCIENDYRDPKQKDLDLYLKTRDLLIDGSLQIPDPITGEYRGVNDYELKLLKRENKVRVKSQSSLHTVLMFEISPVHYWDLFTLMCWSKCPQATLYMEVIKIEEPEPQIEVIYLRKTQKLVSRFKNNRFTNYA